MKLRLRFLWFTGLLGVALVVSVIVSIVLWEAILFIPKHFDREWHGYATEFDPSLGWVPVKHYQESVGSIRFTTNAYGFRSPEVDATRSHILVVGDSITWGYGLDDSETIPAALQSALDPDIADAQVLNLGVAGYGIDQYYLWLRRNINYVNPSLVVLIIFTGNDLADTERDNAYGKSKPLFSFEAGTLINKRPNISKYSCMNFFSMSYFASHYHWVAELRQFLCRDTGLDHKLRWEVVKALLKEIETLTVKHGAKLLVALSPSGYEISKPDDKPGVFHDFQDVLTQGGYWTANFLPSLLKAGHSEEEIFMDGAHYRASSAQQFAQFLAEVINQDFHERIIAHRGMGDSRVFH